MVDQYILSKLASDMNLYCSKSEPTNYSDIVILGQLSGDSCFTVATSLCCKVDNDRARFHSGDHLNQCEYILLRPLIIPKYVPLW